MNSYVILDFENNAYFSRFFPVFSADDEKVGELQVSIVLESLMGNLIVIHLPVYDLNVSCLPLTPLKVVSETLNYKNGLHYRSLFCC